MVDGVAALGPVQRDDGDPIVAINSYHESDCMPDSPAHDQPRHSGHDGTTADDQAVAVDPVRARRAQIERWALLANRIGYLFVALAMALFFIAFAVGFSSAMATSVIVTFVIGCALLAPSIIIGYAVKAAERDDRERGF